MHIPAKTPLAASDELDDLQSSQAQQQETCDSPVQIPLGHVHLCDINPGMLQEGYKKAQETGLGIWRPALRVLAAQGPVQC